MPPCNRVELVGRAVLCPPVAIQNRRARSDAPYLATAIGPCLQLSTAVAEIILQFARIVIRR